MEVLIKELENYGGLWDSREKAERALKSDTKKEVAITCQIRYRNVVLGQTFSNRKLGQMGGSNEGGEYVPYGIMRLKENLFKILAFSSKAPEERVESFNTEIRIEEERKELLNTAQSHLQSRAEDRGNRSGASSSSKGRSKQRKKIPQFFGKTIHHTFEEEGKDVWYKGVAVTVLDDDEYATDCEFEVLYEESDEKYEAKLVEDYRRGWIVCEGRVAKEWIREHASNSKENNSVQSNKRKVSKNSDNTPQKFVRGEQRKCYHKTRE